MEAPVVDDYEAQATQRLRQYLRWAGSPNAPFAFGLVVLYLVVQVPFVGVLAAACAVNAVCAIAADVMARRGRTTGAVYLYCAGLWAIALVLVLGGERLYGVTVCLVIMPVVLSLPYVRERAVLVMVITATSIVTLAGVPIVLDWSLSLTEIPDITLNVIISAGTFLLTVVVVLSAWHSRYTLEEFREHLERVNIALLESERVLEDRVEQRRIEIEEASRQLRLARDGALAANRHKSEFLANMSHELRTPLNAIVGFSEVLQEQIFGDLEPKQLEYATDIHESGHQLLALINNILDIAKIEAGRWELAVGPTLISHVVLGSVEAHASRAAGLGVSLRTEMPDAEMAAEADPSVIRRVADAIIDNALKFTPEGGEVVVAVEQSGHTTDIVVTDSGIGIDGDSLEAIFDEFRQAEADYAHRQKGTGLGLALSRRMAELHGGSISVHSDLGRGSTFTVAIPTEGTK